MWGGVQSHGRGGKGEKGKIRVEVVLGGCSVNQSMPQLSINGSKSRLGAWRRLGSASSPSPLYIVAWNTLSYLINFPLLPITSLCLTISISPCLCHPTESPVHHPFTVYVSHSRGWSQGWLSAFLDVSRSVLPSLPWSAETGGWVLNSESPASGLSTVSSGCEQRAAAKDRAAYQHYSG